jgi:hypothetical protein
LPIRMLQEELVDIELVDIAMKVVKSLAKLTGD